jgi:hypothetical protein
VIDPFSPLFQAHSAVAGDIMPSVADPASAQAVMIVGIIVLAVTAFWAVGGMSAAVWVGLTRRRERGLHSAERGTDKPSAL